MDITEKDYMYVITFIEKIRTKKILSDESFEWLVQIVNKSHCVLNFDTYRKKTEILITMLMIAFKLFESEPIRVENFIRLANYKLTKKEILNLEIEILKLFKYKILKLYSSI